MARECCLQPVVFCLKVDRQRLSVVEAVLEVFVLSFEMQSCTAGLDEFVLKGASLLKLLQLTDNSVDGETKAPFSTAKFVVHHQVSYQRIYYLKAEDVV